MHILDIIRKKRDGQSLSDAEISYFVEGASRGTIPDYQISALLMAIYFRHLDPRETTTLTMAMADSGDRLDLSPVPGLKIDKHSTGGVGDKTSLIVGPAAAAMGIKIAKMSGRGLGHTGGTIDKLESIPGVSCELSEEAFFTQVNRIGIAIAGQTANLAPADKKLYALRDVTETVEEPSLIASSILSKKIAAGADKIILDVKTGSGAFMKNKEAAVALGETMIAIGKLAGLDIVVHVTGMEQPLGRAVGNRLEVWEAVQTLQGKGPADLNELCLGILTEMAQMAGEKDPARAEEKARTALLDGPGYHKMLEWIAAQGGDIRWLENSDKLREAPIRTDLVAETDGFVAELDAYKTGMASLALGAGRHSLEETIVPCAGLLFAKKAGDRVSAGETICTLYTSDAARLDEAEQFLRSAIRISPQFVAPPPLILARLA